MFQETFQIKEKVFVVSVEERVLGGGGLWMDAVGACCSATVKNNRWSKENLVINKKKE